MKPLALLFLLVIGAIPVFAADLNTLQNTAEEQEPVISLDREMIVRLPDGGTSRIVEYFENGDARLDNGFILTPEGYILEGDFAGQRISIPEQKPEDFLAKHADAKEKGEKKESAAREKDPDKTTVQEGSLEDEIAKILTSMSTTKKQDSQENSKKKKAGAKKEKSSKAEKPVASQQKRLYIPPENAKTGNLNFLEGCWRGGSIDYQTKRRLTTCFCFNGKGRGTEKVYDPGYTGTTSGAARANIRRNATLSIHSAPRRTPSGRVVWLEQVMLCRNKGKTAFCTEDFLDGRWQSFATHFERVDSCPR